MYFVQNHLDTLLKPGKKILKNLLITEVENDLAYVKASPEKDSLFVLFNGYLNKKLDKIKTLSEKNEEDVEINVDKIIDSINKYMVTDSLLDEKELLEIKIILKEDLK
jgi:hypothetical protein